MGQRDRSHARTQISDLRHLRSKAKSLVSHRYRRLLKIGMTRDFVVGLGLGDRLQQKVAVLANKALRHLDQTL